MGVKMVELWHMHVFTLAICLLAPPLWRQFVNACLMQPTSSEEPEHAANFSNPADVSSFMQTGIQVNSGTPIFDSRVAATAFAVSQQKGEHEKVHESLVAALQERQRHAAVYVTDGPLDPSLRPNLGGAPEQISFAIYVKNFFGMKITLNEFTVDVVVSLRWTDARVSKLVPADMDAVTMSLPQATHTIWLPDITITNRAIKGQQRISAAVELNKDGTVLKTERFLLKAKQHFDVSAFPFDFQQPKIVLSSATLMSDELVLQVMSEGTWQGAKPGLFEDREFHLVSDESVVFEENDGSLKKSRGKLVMTLKRDWTGYLQTTILPEIFLLLISFTVFWMPRAQGFAMPRVATNLISFLTLMTLSINTASMLPSDRTGMAWIELFADSMQLLNSLILFLNVFVDWVYCTRDLKELGEKMTKELGVLFPLMGFVVVLVCFLGRSGEHLDQQQTLIRLWMLGIQAPYILYSIRRVRAAEREKEAAKS